MRSDLWVRVEVRESGGIEIELQSKVEAYYGEAIRRQAVSVLERMGLHSARVQIADRGALPFVIAARVEAAARAADADLSGDARPDATAPVAECSTRDRLRRSRLYLPGNEPKYLVNAGLYRPDGVILDLEDSVHAAQKTAARLLVRNALRVVDFRGAERMVRINPLPLGLEDLELVAPEGLEMVLIPKVEEAAQVHEVDRALRRLLPGSSHSPWLMPILETALGIENAFAIAGASRRVAALTLGLEDYAADLGVDRSSEGTESAWARGRVLNAARAAGVQAIDSVYGQVDDREGLEAWAAQSRKIGFEGMGCLHPRQIEIIHAAFSPTSAQVERAQKIVDAFDRAEANGLSVVSLGSKMIDPPVVRQAQRLVAQARQLGLIEE